MRNVGWRFLSVAFLLVSPFLHAQVNIGRITGRVTDSSGEVVSGAAVVALDVLTGVRSQATTNADGLYDFPVLQIGTYTVTFTYQGFKKFEQSDVHLVSGTFATVNATLTVGAVNQTVEVSGQAITVDTTSTSSGTTRVNEELASLPVSFSGSTGRWATQNLVSYPGVVYGTNGPPGSNVVKTSVLGTGGGGGDQAVMSYDLDGATGGGGGYQSASGGGGSTTMEEVGLSPEVVQEMRLETNPEAQYGGDQGVVLSLVTKSGTNQFHGEGHVYYQSDQTNARNWFAAKVSPSHQNEKGYTVGGPIKKDKTFFFTSLGGSYYANLPAFAVHSVPTMLMRQGNFSELLGSQIGSDALGRPVYSGEIYDTTTATTVGNSIVMNPFQYQGQLNVIDPTRLSTVSKNSLAAYPVPTASGLLNNWTGPGVQTTEATKRFTLKIDQYLGKQRITGEFFYGGLNATGGCLSYYGPSVPAVSCVNSIHDNEHYGFVHTWTISPNLVLETHGSENYWRYHNHNTPATATFGTTMGLTGFPETYAPYVITQNYSTFGYTLSGQDTYFGTWALNTSLAWAKGKHLFKFGWDITRPYLTSTVGVWENGYWGFNAAETQLPTFPNTGWDMASFMLGDVNQVIVAQKYPGAVKSHGKQWALFAQDAWRLTPKLVANYGVRFEYGTTGVPAAGEQCVQQNFDPTLPNPGAGGLPGALIYYGGSSGNGGCRGVNPYGGIGPRLGLAYSLNTRTVLRAYYGYIFGHITDTAQEGTIGHTGSNNFASLDGGITPAWQWDAGYPTSRLIPGNACCDPTLANNNSVSWLVPNDNKPSRTQAIGAGIERQLPDGIIFKLEYVGKFTDGLGLGTSPNSLPLADLSLGSLLNQSVTSPAAMAAGIRVPYPGFTGTVTRALTPWPQYTGIGTTGRFLGPPDGKSFYNGLFVTAQKHFGAGLTFLASYVWSKYMDDTYEGSQSDQLRAQGRALVAAYATGSDRPNVVNLTWVYELPFGPGKHFAMSSNPVVQRLVGGWQLSGVQQYASGNPLVFTSNTSIPDVGSIWPVRVPGVPIRNDMSCDEYDPHNPAKNRFLNIGAFRDPAPFTLGNVHVTSVRGCPNLSENFSLFKDIPIKERVKIRLDVDAYNAFNRHQWAVPGSGGNTPVQNIDIPSTFGRITSAINNSRTMQFMAKVIF